MCENCLPFNEVGVGGETVDKECVGYTLYSCMLAILRVLLNLTHESSKCAQPFIRNECYFALHTSSCVLTASCCCVECSIRCEL